MAQERRRRIETPTRGIGSRSVATLAALVWFVACVDASTRRADAEVSSDVEPDVEPDVAEHDASDGTGHPDLSPDTEQDTTLPPDVAPTCDPACENAGRCVAPDTCDCMGTGFGGAHCEQQMCGEHVCPPLEDYDVACNGSSYCEYTRAQITEAWHADDVWIHVPAGSFPMGAPDGEPNGSLVRPVVDVTIGRGFFVGKFEVTTRLYEACETLIGGCTPPSANDFIADAWGVNRSAKVRHLHPQNGLTQAQAAKVCAFLEGRLPSSAEWELAAKGPEVHRQYPWGNTPAPVCGEHAILATAGYGCGTAGTFIVGPTERIAGRSASGAFDMAGNVWEWVADCWHDSYEGAPSDGRAWLDDCVVDAVGPLGVIRGGAFTSTNVRAATRLGQPRAIRRADTGVRCAKDAP